MKDPNRGGVEIWCEHGAWKVAMRDRTASEEGNIASPAKETGLGQET